MRKSRSIAREVTKRRSRDNQNANGSKPGSGDRVNGSGAALPLHLRLCLTGRSMQNTQETGEVKGAGVEERDHSPLDGRTRCFCRTLTLTPAQVRLQTLVCLCRKADLLFS